jgi:hypothetical protein
MTQIDPGVNASNAMAVGQNGYEFRMRGESEMTFRYLVESSGGGGWIEFTVDSFHGGSATLRGEIR